MLSKASQTEITSESKVNSNLTGATSPDRKRIQRVYRLLAPIYDATRSLWVGHRLGDAENFLEREILPRYCPQGSVILDLGCGTGANLERLLRLGIPFRHYVGIDLSQAMIGHARSKFSGLGNASFYLGDVEQLPFAQRTFDFALSTWALEHVPQVRTAIGEAFRVLKGEARLILMFHSLPRLPWRSPARLIEPVFKLAFHMRFLTPQDYSSPDGKGATWRFDQGLHTLLLLKKEGES